MPSPLIVVVGSFVQDFTFATKTFPHPGQTVVGRFYTGPGGKGSNQAVAAARAGVSTAFMGAVGRDPFADGARAFLTAEGIDHRLAEKPLHATGTAAILVDSAGQNQIVVALGANEAMQPSDLDRDLIGQAKILVGELEIDLAAAASAFEIARKAGVTTLLNPAPMRADFDIALLALTDILIPNETEFTALVNMVPNCECVDFSDRDLAALAPPALHGLCRQLGVRVVVVTLGARGCFVSTPERFFEVAGVTGIQVVDTTGAGDAFVGAFAAAFVDFGADLERAAQFANVAAALSVTRPGTAPAMARRGEIEAFGK